MAPREEDSNGSRTHEPSLRELTAELDGLRELLLSKIEALKETMQERHALYTERGEGIKAQTAATFHAVDKAVNKAEEAQREYNIRSNEFRGQLDDQAKLLMARTEALSMHKAIEQKIDVLRAEVDRNRDAVAKEITGLRESRSQGSGQREGGREMWGYVAAAIAILLALASLLVRVGGN